MGLTKMSEVAAYNNDPYEARNYRMSLELPQGFKSGDYVPVVVYNAFVGSGGKGMRSLAQKTHARLFSDHAVLDEFDPAVDFSRTPDGHPLFELVGYLIDLNGKEHLFFTIKFQKEEAKPKKLYPSDDFPVGSHPVVRIYRGRTRELAGRKVAEVKGLITEKGLDLPPGDSSRQRTNSRWWRRLTSFKLHLHPTNAVTLRIQAFDLYYSTGI